MHRYIKHLIKYFVLLVISIMLVSTFTTPIYAEGYDFDEGWDDGSGGGLSQEALDNAAPAPDYANDPW